MGVDINSNRLTSNSHLDNSNYPIVFHLYTSLESVLAHCFVLDGPTYDKDMH